MKNKFKTKFNSKGNDIVEQNLWNKNVCKIRLRIRRFYLGGVQIPKINAGVINKVYEIGRALVKPIKKKMFIKK
jgi:hypothetical protein